MIRCLRLSRKLPFCRQQIFNLHTFKTRELDEPAYNKKPLDPHILSIIKKYDSDLFYSSLIELNKKPLTYEQRKAIMQKLRREKEETPPTSILVEELAKNIDAKDDSEIVQTQPQQQQSPNTETIEEPANNDYGDASKIRREEKLLQLAKTKLKILTEMGLRRSALDYELQDYPDNWMEDYETYDESEALADTQFGTPDPTVPISKVPCHGCGSMLQCADTNLPGYLPSELMRNRHISVLTKLICQRCHFLKNYNTALKVQVTPDEYVEMISRIKDEFALAILMVDLVDFPGSIWPNIIDIIGEKRPVVVVGNKVDLLPQDSKNYLNHIRKCLESALIESGLSKTNIKYVSLISSQTNFGIEDLITTLYTIWPNKGNVYLLGNANVGKTTLFNALLGSDYCKIRARSLIRRATSSAWPGTTLRMLKFPISRPSSALLYEREKRFRHTQVMKSELERLRKNQVKTGRSPEKTLMDHIGLSYEVLPEQKNISEIPLTDAPPYEKWFNERHGAFKNSKWLFDTPGVIQNEQIINLLTSEELLYTLPKETLWPRVFYMLPGQTIFLSGIGRVDYVGGANDIRLAVFASDKLSILITNTEMADTIYKECLGTELLNVPRGNTDRIKDFPPLMRKAEKISFGNYNNTQMISAGDIVLSSGGWVTVNLRKAEAAHFYAWTPNGRGIFVRKPSLLPYAAELYRGKRKIYTPAYNQKEPTQVPSTDFIS